MAYSSTSDKTLKKLDTILNSNMRIAIGAFRTSPIISILSESGMTPLNLRREKLTMNYAIRLHTNPENQAHHLLLKNIKIYRDAKTNTKLPSYYRAISLFDKYNIHINDKHVNKIPNNINLTNDDIQINELCINDNSYNKIIESYPNYTHITTSCARNNNSIGAVASIPDDENTLLKLPPWISLQSAAEILLSDIMKENYLSTNKIMIHTDNYEVVNKLLSKKAQKTLTKHLLHNLKKLDKKILICHSKFPIEISKKLKQPSTLASKLEFAKVHQSIDKTDMKKFININIKNEWNKIWTCESNKCNL